MVSTFAGQDSHFGFPTLEEAWKNVKEALQEITEVRFSVNGTIVQYAFTHPMP